MNYKYLKNNRNLKAFFRDASSEEIKQILDRLEALYRDVLHNEEELLQKKKERESFLKNVLESLEGHNYTVDDLAA
ncbi:MAG: hypothetical protein ACI4ND_08055, partial [Succinivibrio sp.]